MRNSRSRKELYFTSSERQIIKIMAARFHIDETSMIRVLLQLGVEAMPGHAHTVANNVPPAALVAIQMPINS